MYTPGNDPNRIIQAAHLAKAAHWNQARKWTERPYITHPARVAMRVMLRSDCSTAMVCAAWLHDTLEDTEVTVERIENRIGGDVAKLVVELTNTSKAVKGATREQRKQMDRERLAEVSREARIIKLIDRIDNLCELPKAAGDFRRMYLEESMQLRQALRNTDEDLEFELQELIKEMQNQ